MEQNPLNSALKQEVLSWPELHELIDQRAEEKYVKMCNSQWLTREKMAFLIDVHIDTVDNLTAEGLAKLGFEKVYVGSLPRFRRISLIEANRETFRRVKKG